MVVNAKRRPWKVVFLTDAAPLPEETYASERAAYQAVNGQRELIKEGVSRVRRAVVYQWQKDSGRWMVFERHNLSAEAKELRKLEDRLQVDGKDGLAEEILDETLRKEK